MAASLKDANPFLPHPDEELRISDADPGVRDLVIDYNLRRWLQWMLSLWGERLPVSDWASTSDVKDEVLAWSWWWSRLSLAEIYPATRLAFGDLAPKVLPLVYAIARRHMEDWLAHLQTLSAGTLFQSVLLARELADPWASAIRDARYAWGLAYQGIRLVLRPGWNFPRPARPPMPAPLPQAFSVLNPVVKMQGDQVPTMAVSPSPTSEDFSWAALLDGAKEFAGMSWRTLELGAEYWANRAYDVPQANLDPRETLFDYQFVESWGTEGEKQLAGRVADLHTLFDAAERQVFVIAGKQPPLPHSPSYTAEMFLPGVRDWMGRVGEYSIRNGAWLRQEGILGPRALLSPDDADAQEVWLQGLVLSGGMYVASASLPRLFTTAKRTVILRAPELTTGATILGALYGVEPGPAAFESAGVRYIVRTDPQGRTWMQAVRSAGGGVVSLLTAPFRMMRDWWRFRKGGRVEWDILIKESQPGLAQIEHTVLANEAATKAGIPGQVAGAISRVLETAPTAAGRAAQQATGTVINLGNTAAGLPLAMPGPGAAGAVQGATGMVQQLGNGAMAERGFRLVKLAGGAAAITGTIPFAAFILEESSQAAGMASYQAARTKNPDKVQEATRRMDSISRIAQGPAVWIPGYNLWVAFSEFFAAQHLSAETFRETTGQVQGLNGAAKPDKGDQKAVRPSPTGKVETPGGRPVVPPTPKAPSIVQPISMEERHRIILIDDENRETILLNEHADLFSRGSRLLFDDTGFVWPPRARGGKAAGSSGIVSTGAPLRVYLLADGRVVLRLPKSHALFDPIKDRMRRLTRTKRAVFEPGLTDVTRNMGLWIIQPVGQGILGEILLNTNDVLLDQLSETELEVNKVVTDTDVNGADFAVPEAPKKTE